MTELTGQELDDEDIFASQPYGKLALKKLTPVAENFMLFECGWLGSKPSEFRIMKVSGAEFRRAKSGKNKGRLSIPIKGTERTVYITKEEISAMKENKE